MPADTSHSSAAKVPIMPRCGILTPANRQRCLQGPPSGVGKGVGGSKAASQGAVEQQASGGIGDLADSSDDEDYFSDLYCPLTLEVMTDPVVCSGRQLFHELLLLKGKGV